MKKDNLNLFKEKIEVKALNEKLEHIELHYNNLEDLRLEFNEFLKDNKDIDKLCRVNNVYVKSDTGIEVYFTSLHGLVMYANVKSVESSKHNINVR